MFSLTLHLPTIICKPLSEQLLLTFPAISTTPTLVRLFSSHPQTLRWGFKVQGPAWKDIIPSVRGPGLPPAPATPSLLGRPGRMRQALRRPRQPRSPRPSRAPGHRQSRTRPPPERGVTRTPKPSPTPQCGQVPGLLTDTHRAAAAPSPPQPQPQPPPLSHSRLFPRGVRAGAASPPDPPSGVHRAEPGYGESRRHRPLSSLLPQCVPPTEARLVFPGSALSKSLSCELPASGLPAGAVARQAQRWRRRRLPRAISRAFPPVTGGRGPRERWSIKRSRSRLLSDRSPLSAKGQCSSQQVIARARGRRVENACPKKPLH